MKYFEIRKITKKEYLEKTKDIHCNKCVQSIISVGNKVYCATKEDSVEFDTELFKKEENNNENRNKV